VEINYVNLHVHSHHSNIVSPDVVITEEALVKKAYDLGMKSLALTDHGTTIGKIAFAKACKKYHIKPIFGMEGYFVKDINKEIEKTIMVRGKEKISVQKDNKNGHILFLAKNEKGLEQINELMSDSYLFGFYSKPRCDIAMINKYLNPKDVIVSSACIGGFLSKEDEDILEHFKEFIDNGNFYLEFQPHNNEKQIAYSKKILEYHEKYKIPILATNDTHALDDKTVEFRDGFLKSKNIIYEEESGGWYIDFPAYAEMFNRFIEQGVLSQEQVIEAIENTNVINEQIEYVDILDDSFKIPILKKYENYTLQERHNILKELCFAKFDQYKNSTSHILEEFELEYIKGIEYELKEVEKCGMADYFLINYEIIQLATNKYDGVITKTSRGSSSCFFINFLLGFTAMDRFLFSKLPLFPERFLTAERILDARTPPDVDHNVADPIPFILAAKELLGEDHVYPMIALGLYRVKSSWKLFSRINNIDADSANEVSKSIEAWEKAVKYADEEHKDEIIVDDFIPEEYSEVFESSKDARSIIDNIKPHPCGLLISPYNLRKKFGLITVGRGENKITCVAIEGIAEKLGYLKLDMLTVSVVDILSKIYKKIGIKQHSPQELLEEVEKDPSIMEIYSNGITAEVNQMTSPRTIKFLKDFQPKTIYDLSTVVAAIRPGAMSVVDRMMSRSDYSYRIDEIDELLSTHTGSAPAIIYQESIMSLLKLANIDTAEAYKILKAISKKKIDVIKAVEEKFVDAMKKRYGDNEENKKAIKALLQQIIDSASYAFNSPHSLATALDSLYMAFLKVKYPAQTYSVLLDYYLLGKKRNLNKTSVIKKEMEKIGYKIKPIKFGQDNREFHITKDNTVEQSIMGMKSSNEQLAEILARIKDEKDLTYIEIYEKIKEPKNPKTNRAYCTKTHWKILCKAEYFPDKNNKKLEDYIPLLYDKVYIKKQFRESSLDKLWDTLGVKLDIEKYCYKRTPKTFYLDPDKKSQLVKDIFDKIECDEYNPKERILNQVEVFGFVSDPEQYFESNIFVASINAVSRKNSSILINTVSGNNMWISITGDITQIKKDQNIVILQTKKITRRKKLELMITEYVVY